MKIYPLNQLNELTDKKAITIFEELPEDSLKYAHLFVYEKNEYIVRFDKSVDHLFFLIDGRAKIYKIHENGKRSLLQFLAAGDFIGELSLLEVEEQVKDVQTIDRCICLALPYHKAKQALLNDNRFLRIIAKYLGKKVLLRVDHFSNNQNYELKHRLAAYMLQTEVAGVYHEKHTETAEFLGVSYRHLMYTLKEFQESGVVEKQDKGYLLNLKKVRALAASLI
ncbi:transcriptional regulator YeiL [Enterococcus termitis]|uniref:Cyclic nucleotide-binding domain-containing protein n=1 Tax=Enterococcus termitis TaxID=332950 RepID=A0A1E5H438_9ENTE|nr:transcriptional regulator YeiL [Enterococcus termitis]OEG19747.1 hypothetical protein BCR25_14970 [Enterococcus termitis]OJG96764.1 hypothetical protein RV18_GL001899 [Enterococcus termitis]